MWSYNGSLLNKFVWVNFEKLCFNLKRYVISYVIFWNQGSTSTIHKKFSGTDQSGVEVNLKEPSIPIDMLKQAVERVKARLQVCVVQEGRHSMEIIFLN